MYAAAVRRKRPIRVRGGIMGVPKCGIVGASQPVLMMIDPMIYLPPHGRKQTQAVATNEVIDLCKIGVHDPAKFFRPVYAEGGGAGS
eukprot:COSAG01_NODE_4238_length_5213_cov_59.185960_4_plen_87_part_00